MKKLKYLLLIFIIFITPNVFAQDFNVSSSDISSPSGGGRTGTYSGLEIYNGGLPAVYNIGTRYNGRLSRIWFNLVAGGYADAEGFEKGHTYTLQMNMATQDWRNGFGNVSVKCEGSNGQELSNGSVTFVSMWRIKFSFTAPSDRFCQFVYIDLKSRDINSVYITGTSNWNLSSLVISDPAYSSGGSGSGSGSGGTTTDPNQSIINNSNQNTQDIINNSNQNTQDIIDNANQNTQDIIDSNKVCSIRHIDKTQVDTTGYYLDVNGSLASWGGYGVTSYIPITENAELKMTSSISGVSYFCFYNENKVKISCLRNSEYNVDDVISIPPYSSFVRFSIFTSNNIPTFSIKECKNGNQAISDVLTDDSEPNIADSEFTNLFNNVGFNDPLSYLLQLPVQFINQLVSQSNTCQTISLGSLWGVSLTLPCIDIGSIIGHQVWDIIDVLFSVGLLVVIFKNLYQTFANLMTMGGEKEAREKFSMPTPMEFLSIILGGDR